MIKKYPLKLVAAFVLISATLTAQPSTTVDEAFTRLNNLASNYLNWHASLYNKTQGRYNGVNFEAQASSIGNMLQVGVDMATMPAHVRQDLQNFLRWRQNPDDGFFYDFYGQSLTSRDRGRFLTFAKSSMGTLGITPYYPYPAGDSLPAHLQSATAYQTWLAALDWTKPWGAGDAIDAEQTNILGLPTTDPLRQALIDTQFNFLPTKQQVGTGKTGYWGTSGTIGLNGDTSTSAWEYLSGAAKLSAVYAKHARIVPSASQIRATAHASFMAEDAIIDGIFIRNFAWICNSVHSAPTSLTPFTTAQQIAIIDKARTLLAPCFNADGGITRVPGTASSINGSGAYVPTRLDLWRWVAMRNAQPVPPIPNASTYWTRAQYTYTGRKWIRNQNNSYNGMRADDAVATEVKHATYSTTDARQKWFFIAAPTTGDFWIKSFHDNTRVLAVTTNSDVNRGVANDSALNQKWTVRISSLADHYWIVSETDGKTMQGLGSTASNVVWRTDLNSSSLGWTTIRWTITNTTD